MGPRLKEKCISGISIRGEQESEHTRIIGNLKIYSFNKPGAQQDVEEPHIATKNPQKCVTQLVTSMRWRCQEIIDKTQISSPFVLSLFLSIIMSPVYFALSTPNQSQDNV